MDRIAVSSTDQCSWNQSCLAGSISLLTQTGQCNYCSHVWQHICCWLPEKSGGGGGGEGTISHLMSDLAVDICLWAESRGMILVPRHIPGHLNVLADHLSKKDQILKTEWSLNQIIVDTVSGASHRWASLPSRGMQSWQHICLRSQSQCLDICLWAESRGMILVSRHIPGHFNVLADHLSKKDQLLKTEWSLNQTIVDTVSGANHRWACLPSRGMQSWQHICLRSESQCLRKWTVLSSLGRIYRLMRIPRQA